jgi:hypothetical protein
MSSLKTIIHQGGDVFIVLRKMHVGYFHKNNVLNEKVFHLWREELGSNAVIRIQDYFLFCEKIEDAEEIIEEQVKIEQNDNNNNDTIGDSNTPSVSSTRTSSEIQSTPRTDTGSDKGRRKSRKVSK